MVFTLIPFPLSAIVVIVFVLVAELVLWKLRKNGKTYRIISNIAVVLGVLFLALILILLISTGLNPS